MSKDRITADEITRAITGRISTGVYPLGAPLPSLRRLADEIGANRNTVQKACHALLQLGILEAPPGRRSLLVRRAPQGAGVVEHFRQQARSVIWEAMAAGVPRDQALGELGAIVDQVYSAGDMRIRFLECNRYDSDTLGGELTRLTGTPIAPGLIDELRDSEALAGANDLIVTTFHHLAEVSRALVAHADKVVGVDTRPSPETVLGIARLSMPRIGLVCTLPDTARMLQHIILSYQRGCQVEPALIDVPGDVRRVVQTCDHLVVTHNCLETLAAVTDRRPDVVIEFRIDEQSIVYLRERIRMVRLGARRT